MIMFNHEITLAIFMFAFSVVNTKKDSTETNLLISRLAKLFKPYDAQDWIIDDLIGRKMSPSDQDCLKCDQNLPMPALLLRKVFGFVEILVQIRFPTIPEFSRR